MGKKKNFGTYLSYYFFRFMLGLFWLIPFSVCYGISNILFLILYHLVSYRKKIVRQNIKNSFPNKSEQELKTIEVKFYRHLSDIFVEGIKGLSMSDAAAKKRWKILSPEAPNVPFAAGKPTMFIGAHYNNWEWGALATGIQVNPQVIVFYKPISNPLVDQYVRKMRMHKGVFFAPINETRQTFEEWNPKSPMYNLIADQSPSNPHKSHWVKFLNQETGVLHGPAQYAQEYGLSIFYIYINKVKRGFYEISAELFIENPNDYSQEEISRKFMAKVEEQILEKPEYWLWSHKRWKHKMPEGLN